MTHIAFFSNRMELEILQRKPNFEDLKLIAITPEADLIAEEAKLPYKTIEDYYDELEINQRGVEAHEIVSDLCKQLDSLFFPPESLFSSFDVFMLLKVTFDQLLLSSFIIHKIIEYEKPKNVFLSYIPPIQQDLYTNHNDDILMNTIVCFLKSKNIKYELYNSYKDIKEESMVCFSFKDFFSKQKTKFKRAILRILRHNSLKVFIAQHWDFEVCSNMNRHFKTYWLNDLKLPKFISLQGTVPCLNERQVTHLKRFFEFYGVFLLGMMEPKLSHLVQYTSKKFSNECLFLKTIFKNKKIDAVVAAAGQSIEILAAIKAARLLSLPVIWGQHGGFYGYADFPIFDYLNKNYTDYFLHTNCTSKMLRQDPHYVVSSKRLLELYKAKRNV